MDTGIFDKLRQFDCTLAGETLDVYEIRVDEAVFAEDSVAEVTVVAGRRLTIHDYVGKEGLLTLIGKKTDRHFHGMIRSMEEVETRGRFFLFKATLVPCLWPLSQISDVRIFQNKTVPDIITEILESGGILSNQVEFRTEGSYAPREYCVQYRETHLAFIRRLMSDEGMFCYYEFTDSGHKLIFGDSAVCHKTLAGVPEVLFSAKGQLVNQTEYVTRFDVIDAVTSGSVHLSDYHFQKPSYAPVATVKADTYTELELYDYPGYLDDETTGRRLAQVRLEHRTQNRLTMNGHSVCRRFTPGHRFTLTGHLNPEANAEYTLTRVIHTGKQPQSLQEVAGSDEGNTYGNTFLCLPSSVSFRPDRPKTKPSVQGIQTAVVTGPEGEEIYTDQYGRIKVQFHWDRLGENDDKTSCWMRVAQPWAGSGWGSVFIPRIGQEVVVSFIDGDPDRPLVTGAVYNGRNMPPYALPDEKTKSTIKTESTPGGGGFNELRFEDKKGEEEIYIHGEKDWNIDILNDKGQTIGHDEKLDVGNDRTKSVGNDQKESIGNNKDITVAKTHTEDIGEDMRLTVGKNMTQKVGENKAVDVGKNRDETVGENTTVTIGNDESREIGNNQTLIVKSNSSVDVGKDTKVNVGDNTVLSTGKNLSVDAGEAITVSAGKTMTLSSDGSDLIIKTGGATIKLAKNGDISLDGANINIKASGKITMNGSAINQN